MGWAEPHGCPRLCFWSQRGGSMAVNVPEQLMTLLSHTHILPAWFLYGRCTLPACISSGDMTPFPFVMGWLPWRQVGGEKMDPPGCRTCSPSLGSAETPFGFASQVGCKPGTRCMHRTQAWSASYGWTQGHLMEIPVHSEASLDISGFFLWAYLTAVEIPMPSCAGLLTFPSRVAPFLHRIQLERGRRKFNVKGDFGRAWTACLKQCVLTIIACCFAQASITE